MYKDVDFSLMSFKKKNMKLLKGYREFFDRKDDPNLRESIKKNGVFYIFSSIEAWKREKCKKEDIPEKELIYDEYSKNRFIAPP